MSDPDPGSTPSASRSGNGQDWSLLDALRNWFRGGRRRRNGEHLRDAIEELIGGGETAAPDVESDERHLIKNILELHDQTVADVMVPRADIVAVEESATLDEIVRLLGEGAHSRIPVYRRNLDDVIGMVHIRDVLGHMHGRRKAKVASIVREILFVAPSMRVLDLLLEMRTTRRHMALVVDEFGGIDGLVTIEDLVEEIVGEIEDEHDRTDGPCVTEGTDGVLIADARVPLEELEGRLGPMLTAEEREHIDTLGGLVFALAGRVPARGEVVLHPSGFEFEVIEADPRKIKRLRVRRRLPVPQPAS